MKVFEKLTSNLEQFKRQLPRELAKASQEFFRKNFSAQEWEGDKWPEVKRRQQKKRMPGRPKNILVDTGNLRSAVARSIRYVSFPITRLAVELPYAAVHNYGDGRVPQRKYFGDNKELRNIHTNIIHQQLKKWLG